MSRTKKQSKKRKQQLYKLRRKKQAATNPTKRAERTSRRLSYHRPRSWNGEPIEDTAVFDTTVRKTLSTEHHLQATAVAEALQMIGQSSDQQALECVNGIPRNSPFSQWRMLIRGLVHWYADDFESATTCWAKLDNERRAGRIAQALSASQRDDLEDLHATPSDPSNPTDLLAGDPTLCSAAKLVRQIRIERPAITEAILEANRSEQGRDLLLGPKKLSWLKDFSDTYRHTESNLVRALQLSALEHASCQQFVDIFEKTSAAFTGPPHDPRNSLRQFFYWRKFENGMEKADRMIQIYIKKDLPNCTEISDNLRNALLSQIHLSEARSEMMSPDEINPFMNPYSREDARFVEQNLKSSITAYPSNSAAHKEYVDWLKQRIDNDRTAKTKRDAFNERLPAVMENWSKSLPEDVEPRLWLVDHYLENEETEQAKPHVEWLRYCRENDPRVRAIPWKWHLLEAMRLSRRKSQLGDVQKKLDDAESEWPAWLSREWLPYLRAAYALRCQNTDQFTRIRDQIREASTAQRKTLYPLTDAVMMMAAAQRMRVPSADLKSLREPIDAAVKKLRSIEMADLISVGSFFWDLQRLSLVYPAYRMHGSKFCKELLRRFKSNSPKITESMHAAIFWMSEHRFGGDSYDFSLPNNVTAAAQRQPHVAAAALNALLRLRRARRLQNHEEEVELVREAATDESDPFYRHLFRSLAEKADEKLTVAKRPAFPSIDDFTDFFEDLANRFDRFRDDDDDPSFSEDQCDCPSCTARRLANATNQFDTFDDLDFRFDLNFRKPNPKKRNRKTTQRK